MARMGLLDVARSSQLKGIFLALANNTLVDEQKSCKGHLHMQFSKDLIKCFKRFFCLPRRASSAHCFDVYV